MVELFVRNPKVEMAPMKDETVLFNPTNSKFCVLNATAAYIWQSLEHPKTAQEIADAVVNHFANVNLGQAEQDVKCALTELRGIDCIELQLS